MDRHTDRQRQTDKDYRETGIGHTTNCEIRHLLIRTDTPLDRHCADTVNINL